MSRISRVSFKWFAFRLSLLCCWLMVVSASSTPTASYKLRLVDGVTLLDGRLELQPLPTEPWGTVCSNVFKESKHGPNAACRSLGFYNTTESYFVGFGRGDPTSPIWLDGVTCQAQDQFFQNCSSKPLGDHNCGHGDDSGVRCVAPRKHWEFVLVNSTIPNRGLVLFRPYPFLPWGTVHMPILEARYQQTAIVMRRAMCQSLGINVSYPVTGPPSQFGTAHPSAPTYLRLAIDGCGGNSTRVASPTAQNCTPEGFMSQYTWGASEQLRLFCDHWEIHSTIEIQLVNGFARSNGQIQYRPDSYSPWMYIAYQALLWGDTNNVTNASAHNWRALNAVCRQAGFTDVINASFRFFGVWPAGGLSPPAQVAAINCSATARSLLECNMTRTHDHSMYIPAGVDCYPERTRDLQWEFRLHNKTTPSKGIAQMRLGPNALWGSITTNETNNFGLWDAFCNAVGYPSGSTRITRNLTPFMGNDNYTWTVRNTSSLAPAYLSRVSCPVKKADTTNLAGFTHAGINLQTDCSYEPLLNSFSVGAMAMVVDCDSTNIKDTSQWQVRINGSNGLVEFRPDRSTQTPWGIVCSTDNNALNALCAMAGYGDTRYVEWVNKTGLIHPAPDLYDRAPIFMYGLKCPDGSLNINGCVFEHFEAEFCVNTSTAGVDCYATPNNPRLWTYQLVGGSQPGMGLLEIKLAPWLEWGTICDDYWSAGTIAAACRSLGFETDGRTMRPRLVTPTLFPASTGKILLDDMDCSSVRYLENCTKYLFLEHNCGQNENVALQCWPPEPVWGGGGVIKSTELAFRTIFVDPEEPTIVRIEVRIPEVTDWGSIHMSSWSNYVLDAACLMSGVTPNRPERVYSTSYQNRSSSVILGGFSCSPAATHLANCSFDRDTYMLPNNDHSYDMIIDCQPIYSDPKEWKLRLRDGHNESSGRLEIQPLSRTSWGTVCDDNFERYAQNPVAACASLGFDHNERLRKAGYGSLARRPTQTPILLFPQGQGKIWLNHISCLDNNKYIQNCSHTFRPTGCSHIEDVGLVCEHKLYRVRDFDFRFIQIEEGIPGVGRIEMRPSPEDPWGTVFQSNLTNLSVARAACRSAGFENPYPWFGKPVPGKGPVYVHNFECPPNADTLNDCTADGDAFLSSSNHSLDLTIECDYVAANDTRFWEFKLVDGEHVKPHFGRVMFRPAPWTVWGTFNASDFNPEVAASICRSIGYTEENGYRDPVNAQFTMNLAPTLPYGRVWVWSTLCPSRPLTYFQNCSFYQWRPAVNNHSTDAWIDCYPVIQAKMVDGPALWHGRIMIKYNNWTNVWGTMCNDEFVSNHYAWLAVCRTAGFTNVTLAKYQDFGEGTGPISLDDLDCTSDQQVINDCTHRQVGTHNCYHSEDAGVNCYAEPDDKTIWKYRFWGTGSTETKGRIEMLPTEEDMWGMLCPNIFNHTKHAWIIACHTLGITTSRAIPMSFGAGYGPIYLDNINCSRSDGTLRECESFPLGSYECSPSEAMGLDCAPPPENVGAWEFKLDNTTIKKANSLQIKGSSVVNGTVVATAGTVMVRFNPNEKWGTICASNKQFLADPALAAEIICRSLGLYMPFYQPKLYRSNTSTIKAPEWYPIVLSNISCSKGVKDLRHCAHNDMYDHSCPDHSQDLHVDCMHRDPRTKTHSGVVTHSATLKKTLTVELTTSEEVTLTGALPKKRSRLRTHTTTLRRKGNEEETNTVSRSISDRIRAKTPSPVPIRLTRSSSVSDTNLRVVPHTLTVSGINRSLTRSKIIATRTITPPHPTTTAPTTVTSAAPTTTTETAAPRPDFSLRTRCSYVLAVSLDKDIKDEDIRGRNIVINISLPSFMFVHDDKKDNKIEIKSILPFYFRQKTIGNQQQSTGQSPNNSSNNTISQSFPFLVPHPLIRIFDQNVGTNEPRGYTMTYGADGQSPRKSYGGGWWGTLAENNSSFSPQYLTGGDDMLRLASKHDGKVYCEVISTKIMRCVIPKAGEDGYFLYAEDRLVIRISPQFLEEWIGPSCYTTPSGDEAAYVFDDEGSSYNGNSGGALRTQPINKTHHSSSWSVFYEGVGGGLPSDRPIEVHYRSTSSQASGFGYQSEGYNYKQVDFVVDASEPSAFGAAVDGFGPVAGTVSVIAAIIGGASAMDIQIVAMLGQSACMGEIDRRSTSILRYFISPFFDLGLAAVAYGNLLVALIFGGLQFGLAKQFQYSRRIRELDSWAATRFPSYSYACAQLVYVGICYGSVNMLSGRAAASGVGEDNAASFVAGSLGTILCFATVAGLIYIALRVVTGKFVQYTQFLSRPWYYRWIYPLGFWEQPAQRLAYGYLLNPYRQGERLKLFSVVGFVTSLATAIIMLISPIPCEVRLGLVGILFLLVALMYAVLRPARLPTNTAFSVAGQVMMAMLAFIAAAQIINPTVAMMNAKLALLFLQILLVFLRSVFSIVINIMETVRWSKFREQNDEFADDDELLEHKAMPGLDDEDLELLIGSGGYGVGGGGKTEKRRAKKSKTIGPNDRMHGDDDEELLDADADAEEAFDAYGEYSAPPAGAVNAYLNPIESVEDLLGEEKEDDDDENLLIEGGERVTLSDDALASEISSVDL